MTEQMTLTFIPQTAPPDNRHDPAYWFAFQDDKMVVRAVEHGMAVPLLADIAELGVAAVRQQYLGYLQDGGRADPLLLR